jgi:hypothetical protein
MQDIAHDHAIETSLLKRQGLAVVDTCLDVEMLEKAVRNVDGNDPVDGK